MPRTIAAVGPAGTGLLVEVSAAESATQDMVYALRARLRQRCVRVGILITRTRTVVLRDWRDDRRLDTGDLFAGANVPLPVAETDEALVVQVMQMLRAIGDSWYEFLHPSAVTAMVPDVVGNLAQAVLEEV